MPQITIVLDNIYCPKCEKPEIFVYLDKDEKLICLGCRKQGRETVIKLVNPGVVIGRFIQN